MTRIKVQLPQHFHFVTELDVHVTDINYGGHLGNDRLLGLVHEARVRFFTHLGFSELDVAGVGTIMTDAAVVYKSEAFQGNVIRISLAVGDFNKYGCDLYYKLVNKKSGKEIARVKTGLAFYDYGEKKLRVVPDQFRKALNDISI